MRDLAEAHVALRAALDAGDLDRARRLARGWPALRGPGEALLWVELLWVDRDRTDRMAVAETLLEAFPERGEIVHPCAEIVLDELGGVVPGDPPRGVASARRALVALDTALATLGDAGSEQAVRLLSRSRASTLARAGAPPDEVEEAWAAILSSDPSDGGGWFELALWLKYQGRFREGLGASMQAAALLGDQAVVWWNVGICATGCGDGARATLAWQRLGLAVRPGGDGLPVLEGAGLRWVRVVTTDPVYGDPARAPEVFDVPVQAVGPCDGMVLEAPPEAIVAEGTRLLHDGTPLGAGPEGRPRMPALAVLGHNTRL